MVKSLGNWICTERLMELASYILEKKEKLVEIGALSPECEGLCAISGFMN